MMTRLSISLLACLGLSVGACTSDPAPDATLTVVNQSDYTIAELYLTASFESGWGPNQLGGDVLLPDEEITLGADCDFYDAMLVDEDDVECEIYDLDLCLNDAEWIIRNNTCTVFGARESTETRARAATTPTASPGN
ncbi:MAG: hypothetical protein WKG01_08635 [Kofleriaceae bacterium]